MRKLLLVLLLGLSLVLAACGGGAAETGDDTEAEPAATEETEMEPTEETGGEEEPAPTEEAGGDTDGEAFTCDDAIGCVDIAEGDPIRLAYMLVIAGENESLGIDSRNGIEIAIDDRGGELLGHPLELTGEDDGCSPEGGQTAAQRIAAEPSILAVVGTSCSSAARVAIPLITEAGMTMISSSNTAVDLTLEDRGEEFAGYLRTAHSDAFQGALAADFAYNELGVRSAATIHDGSIYADGLQQVFAARFQELGGTITSQEAINVGDTDMTSVLGRIATDEAEMIYYPVFVAEAGFITSQARDVDGLEEVVLMGADAAFSIDFLEAAGDAGVGMYFSSPYTDPEGGPYRDFLTKHEEKFGGPPPSAFHAHAYDAANIILNAIEEVAVQDADGTLHIGRQALRDAIFATSGYEGITGTLTCSASGDCGNPDALAVYEVSEETAEDPEANFPPDVVYRPGQ